MPLSDLWSREMHKSGFMGFVDSVWMCLNRLSIIFSMFFIVMIIIVVIILIPHLKNNNYAELIKHVYGKKYAH